MLEGCLLVSVGVLGILVVICFYPVLLVALPRQESPPPPDPEEWPPVTIITGARNAAGLLPAKLENFCALNYPPDRLTFLVASDASTDATREIITNANDPRIRLIEQTQRQGKAAAMNRAAEQAEGELLLFSDADAQLASDAVRKLVRHFDDPRVGGVCGLRVPTASASRHRNAQQTYISLDSRLKQIESVHGRISSNDGKIHMIRRRCFQPIPPDVTDDFYTGLSVIKQGYKLLFDAEARAEVRVPSKNLRKELSRRQRIVTRSLTCILRMRSLLNPHRFGLFACGLMINKIGRRLLPFFILLAGAGAVWMLAGQPRILTMLIAAGAVVLAVSRHAQYIAAGLAGTAWGVLGFLCGRRISVWDPGTGSGSGK